MYRKSLFILFLLCSCAFSVWSQSDSTEYGFVDTTIVQSLARQIDGAQVIIHQDSVLDIRLSRNSGSLKTDNEGNIVTQGYRIQFFSDNKRNSRDEAENRSDIVAENLPELPIYVTYLSPFWRLRVGNYRTYEEANTQMWLLKKKFPQYAVEMRIVKDEIVLPLYKEE
ncbi:MAG: SPOR domain-containing protein [Porphyromonadaceae bacterium]|nr:SPOR domain-containing protein [Porphyromonadaceae bacterium]